jgi:CRISPR/Cas system CMR-associated protein Cmr5 small subunit
MASLYEISADYQNLLDAIENGEIPEDAITDTLDAVLGTYDEKLDNIACMIKNQLAESEGVKSEADKLTARAKSLNNSANRLKTYLAEIMLKDGREKFTSNRNKISFRLSKSVEVQPGITAWAKENNRNDLLKFTDPEPNKSAIKTALESGQEIPFATIAQHQKIQIK